MADGDTTTTDATADTTADVGATDGSTLLTGDSAGGDTGTPDAAAPDAEPAAPAEPAKADPEPAEGVPEEYAPPVLPEGVTLDADMVKSFAPVAKEIGLSQEAYQKVVDYHIAVQKAEGEKVFADFQKQRQTWRQEVTSQDGHEQQIALAKKALASDLVPDSLRELVTGEQAWLGDHPGMIGFLAKVGNLIKEDSLIDGNTNAAPKSAAQVLFPNHK